LYSLLLAQVSYELLVTVALGTAQVEVAVDGGTAVAQTHQDHEQGGAVGTSAKAHDYVCAVIKQTVAADELTDFV
jgi:hypothetical protein